MWTRSLLGCAGAVALLVAGTTPALADPVPSGDVQKCSDQIQNNTLLYINAVQKQIRLSIKNNLKGHDSKCAAGLACSGGVSHGLTCTSNANCTGGECTVSLKSGIGGQILKAKQKLRAKIIDSCLDADLLLLYGVDGTERCPDPDLTPDGLDTGQVADCILGGAIGDIDAAIFGDAAGEVLGRGAPEIVPGAPEHTDPISVCGVGLGSVLQIGSESATASNGEAGGPAPLTITGCAAGVCTTQGGGAFGNSLTAPTATKAGTIDVCLWTHTGNAGNGTPETGSVTISGANHGQQSSFSPIFTTVLVGTLCPSCDASSHTCNGGPNSGLACANGGSTDVACPPTVVGSPPIIPNPLDLDTEPNVMSVPANNPGGGATNPAATFCGACDVDDTVGCQNDQDCIDQGVCSGVVGSGCCTFGTNTGAFGDDNATSARADGLRGPYVPKLATIFCTGKSGSALVDASQGLPGPARLVQAQLNAFEY